MNRTWAVYLFLLVFGNVMSAANWKVFSRGEKTFGLLLFLTLGSELICLFADSHWHNNMPIYHFFNPIQFLLTSLYFNYSITYFRRKNLGIIIGVAGVLLSVLNTLFLQKLTAINSNFLLFEGTVIVIYCLLSLHQILMDEEHLPYRFVHFWVTICCLIYWSTTFTGWGLYTIMSAGHDKAVLSIFNMVRTGANFFFYFGIGLTFAFYKRLIPSARA